MSRDPANLFDLLLAARRVVEFTGGADEESFLADPQPPYLTTPA